MVKRFYTLLFICVFINNQVYGQEVNTSTKLYKNISNENAFWGIDRKRILSEFDTAIIIHYEGSVYQFLKSGNSLIVKQNITTQKVSDSNRVIRTYKNSKDIFHADVPDSSLGYKLFNWLSSIDSSAYSKLLKSLKVTISSDGLPPTDLFIESFKKGRYSFSGISSILIDQYRMDSNYLHKMLLDFIKENKHWKVLGNLLRKGGPGNYRVNKYSSETFKFLKRGKFYHVQLGVEFDEYPERSFRLQRFPMMPGKPSL